MATTREIWIRTDPKTYVKRLRLSAIVGRSQPFGGLVINIQGCMSANHIPFEWTGNDDSGV